MINVNILTSGMGRGKGRAFILPILRHQEKLSQTGINCHLFKKVQKKLTDCDVLIIEDIALIDDKNDSDVREKIQELSEKTNCLLWFDTTDSTGTIQTSVVPYVDGYYKKQLLSDREKYLQPLYTHRPFTDYYHSNFNIKDTYTDYTEEDLIQIKSDSDLQKLGVFWNYSQNLYLPFDPGIMKIIFKSIGQSISLINKINWNRFYSSIFCTPIENPRPIDISGRYGMTYKQNTVEFHRELMSQRLSHRFDTSKVSTLKYWKELRESKVLLSPFGLGEICHRDFEGFLSGCLLIKPRMDHLDTWPPLFEANETMLAVEWDMSDLEKTVDYALNNYQETKEIAKEGQRRYSEYVLEKSSGERFVNHFESIIKSEIDSCDKTNQ